MKLIGVGLGRTGTTSLKAALEQLGANPCFHMKELIAGKNRSRDLPYWIRSADGEPVDWHEVFEPWQATVDWPACSRWEELIDAFPDAPVLLNVRDFDAFYESCLNTIMALEGKVGAGDLAPGHTWEVRDTLQKLIWHGDFQGRFDDKEAIRRMYHERIEAIKARVSPDRLVLWELGVDGWEPLARALGVDVPATPFPRLNDTNEFRAVFGLPPLP